MIHAGADLGGEVWQPAYTLFPGYGIMRALCILLESRA